jgi:hypothetical protein
MATKFVKGNGPQKLKIESVFAAVKSVVTMGDEKAFLKRCRDEGMRVTVTPELIKLLKEHLDEADQKRRAASKTPSPKKMSSFALETNAVSASYARMARRIRECDDTEEC